MDIKKQLMNYLPINQQEVEDKKLMLDLLDTQEHLFTRVNRCAHFTASAWVVNQTKDKVLMAYHNLYDSWAWLGGHADGNRNLLEVAMKEVKEESSLREVRPLSEEIFSMEVLTVDGHDKRGHYIPSHLHLNVTYLLEADEKEPLKIKPDENSQVGWFNLDEAIEASNEEWFKERIYTKLNVKLQREFVENKTNQIK
ncbi:NUDIX hydrolase [Vagococcus xieshaowenii]|uniref:NUDIX domain-containing protein n=1 Tax=Vagococcus xieshaowenii TaxID=2562451 RepID=A0AAJ5EHE3_9ENTE|nr:NUDIX hydrolase [Vagococcus xieshaowenii]QCA28765.1 NUDIX domain-containing protein [Vagococcus xieshaowenii]TFZ43034.1 NUDIX domain-containing protein [Vagococcus xieshaowenii]